MTQKIIMVGGFFLKRGKKKKKSKKREGKKYKLESLFLSLSFS